MATKEWREKNKESMQRYRREWYAKNRSHAKKRVYERRREIREWFSLMKGKLKCACGNDHMAGLDFHHDDPNKKEMNMALIVNRGWSKKRILKEMEKCKVMCAYCHRVWHWEKNHAKENVPA